MSVEIHKIISRSKRVKSNEYNDLPRSGYKRVEAIVKWGIDYGKTHSVWIDTFKPEARPQKPNVVQEEENQAAANNDGVDSIPF